MIKKLHDKLAIFGDFKSVDEVVRLNKLPNQNKGGQSAFHI